MDRDLIGALWPNPASTGLAVTAGSGMTVNIAAGRVAIPTGNQTGAALCTSDATEQVTLSAAPPSGTNRIDLVVAMVRATDIDGGANNDWILTTVTGAGAASPTAPAVPANCVALAQIYVTGGTAAIVAGNITDRRPSGLAVPPKTLQAEVLITAQQAGIAAAVVDVVGSAVTFIPQAGRLYRVSVTGTVFNNNAPTGAISVYITDAANAILATQQLNSAAGIVANWPVSFRTPKLSGLAVGTPVTYKARANISAGTDLRVIASPTAPWVVTAEDVGSA